MRQYYLAAAVLVSTALAGCGGGSGSSDLPAKPKFTSLVSFGDSLSDVGSYKVGAVAAAGGGQFTINVAGAKTNWIQIMADQLGQAAPCAAQTGLDDGSAGANAALGTYVATVNHSGCTAYAQGGARVTNPVGIGNKSYPAPQNGKALTVPIVTQVANHLTAVGGAFAGTEIVFVMAGANDILTQAGTYSVLQGAPYNMTAAQALAKVQADTITAADDLATQVTTQMIGKGAKYVVVLNVPDIASTPHGVSLGTAGQGLLDGLVKAYNAELQTKLAGNASVLLVDAFAANHDEVVNPARYGLTNVTTSACDVTGTYLTTYFSGSSLGCTPGGYPSAAVPNSLIAGVAANTHYLFADGVHPTPYAHALFTLYVLQAMTNKGWY